MPAAILLGVIGVWLLAQATAGRLPARLLSYRDIRPGEVPSPQPASSGPSTEATGSPVPGSGAVAGGAITQYRWPVHGPVTQVYGHNGHPGFDIGVPTGTPVVAVAAGVVTLARWNDGYGNQVQVDIGAGYTFSVAHLSRIDVRQGDRVEQSELLGLSGSTGESTGPHVHVEIRHNGQTQDPAAFIGGTP